MSVPITYPQEFLDRLVERQIQDAEKFHPRLTPEQAAALIHLLAKATRAGCLPSIPETLRLLDGIEEKLPPREPGRLPMFKPHELASMLFEEAGSIWLAHHRRHIHERTAFDYLKWIKCLDWFFHGMVLREITLTHLEQYQTARMAGELGPKKNRAGPVCINHELGSGRISGSPWRSTTSLSGFHVLLAAAL